MKIHKFLDKVIIQCDDYEQNLEEIKEILQDKEKTTILTKGIVEVVEYDFTLEGGQ